MGVAEMFFGWCLNKRMAEKQAMQGVGDEGVVCYALVAVSKGGGCC
jgi:hypothetical protein